MRGPSGRLYVFHYWADRQRLFTSALSLPISLGLFKPKGTGTTPLAVVVEHRIGSKSVSLGMFHALFKHCL